MRLLLLLTVLVIATCGLIYELVAGALASYLLGDSVTQFSTIIGLYLFAMGCGSWLSRYIERDLLTVFVRVELLLGLVGGFSALVLFLAFDWVSHFRVLLYGQVLLIGVLVGLEIPLLMRLLRDAYSFAELVSQVFTFDYIGALFASLLFPLVLVPQLGLAQTSLLFGMVNVGVGLCVAWVLGERLRQRRFLLAAGVAILVLQGVGMAWSERLLAWAERRTYAETVVLARSSPYQRIVLTRRADETRLYLNGNLQFSSRDEHRYHEALVHPALTAHRQPRRVLVLGGGDGLAVREILRHPRIEHVDLVDLDPEMTRLFRSNALLVALNDSALHHPRVQIHHADAFRWLAERQGPRYDVIVCDFPDPSSYALGKLYTTRFYDTMRQALAPNGVAVVQSTSPWVARRSFWCVAATLEAVGFCVRPYHAHVPSFGEWGYVLAAADCPYPQQPLPPGLRFLTAEVLPQLFAFPPDLARLPVEINRLNNQQLVRYFDAEWEAWAGG